ncbi:MAG: RNA methyltransferase [Rhodothermales bacterium]
MKEVRSLGQKKYRDRYGETIVEGVRAVESALDAGAAIRDVLVTADLRRDDRLAPRLDALGDRVHVVDESDIGGVATVESSQGILAVVAVERLDADRLADCERVLALDRLRDPGNAGTLVRSAAWFGVDAIVTGRGTVDLYNPKVVRSAMGGLWDVAHAEVTDVVDTLRDLQEAGFTVYGADMSGTAVEAWMPVVPSVLVLGSEAHGLSDGVERAVVERIVIPGRPRRGATESLNVAVAAGILMHAWTTEQR